MDGSSCLFGRVSCGGKRAGYVRHGSLNRCQESCNLRIQSKQDFERVRNEPKREFARDDAKRTFTEQRKNEPNV